MRNLEDNQIKEACSKCFREHDNKCVALNECCLSYSKTLEDLKAEYGFYVKAFKTECKHGVGTETQTFYDVLNGYTVVRVRCVSCHVLLIMNIYKTVNIKNDNIPYGEN